MNLIYTFNNQITNQQRFMQILSKQLYKMNSEKEEFVKSIFFLIIITAHQSTWYQRE